MFDEMITLPDRTYWKPSTDLSRFTDPNHPDFWRSDDPDSPAYGGKETQIQKMARSEKKPRKRRKKGDKHE